MTPLELLEEIRSVLRRTLRHREHIRDEGWDVSPLPYGLLFPENESRHGLHKTYAVGLPTSDRLAGNQREQMGVMTTVGIDFTMSLTSGEEVESYDQALEAEMEMLRAIAEVKDDMGQMALAVQRIQRSIMSESLMVVEIICTVPHGICLT